MSDQPAPDTAVPDPSGDPEVARAAADVVRFLNSGWLPPGVRPTRRQFEFLLCPAKEALYGGAVGGGKSIALLMAAAMYVDVPGYAALLLRRSFRHLNQPGALIPVSKEWWTNRAEWNAQDHRWTFPSGATVTFGYLEHEDDTLQYDGAAFQYVGYDEIQQFTESQYKYLFQRMRRRADGEASRVPIRMRASAMPGGPGHVWVKERFLSGNTKERMFVPAKLADNPHLDRAGYEATLSELDEITRRQRLEGDWEAYEGGRFFREWFEGKVWARSGDRYFARGREATSPNGWLLSQCPTYVVADLAASEKKKSDYTVFGAFAVTPENDLLVLDMVRERFAVEKIVPNLLAFCRRQAVTPSWVGVESDGFQVAITRQAMRTPGMPSVRELKTEGRGKLVRATPAINRAAAGQVFFPAAAPWLKVCLAELVQFTGDDTEYAHDDIVDVIAWGALEMSHAAFTAPESAPLPAPVTDRLDPYAQGGHTQDRLNPFRHRAYRGDNPYGRRH